MDGEELACVSFLHAAGIPIGTPLQTLCSL
jgi:hypothetical protein